MLFFAFNLTVYRIYKKRICVHPQKLVVPPKIWTKIFAGKNPRFFLEKKILPEDEFRAWDFDIFRQILGGQVVSLGSR